VKEEEALDLTHHIGTVIDDLAPRPYQLPMGPFFRREDPDFLQHVAFKKFG